MKGTIDRRYPNGEFQYGQNYSIEETRKHIKSIARVPKDLKKILKKLRDGALDKSYRSGGWTARQIIHHIADSHMNAYIRFKLAATENAPIIKPYEESLWAETEDAKHGAPKTSLKLLAALHIRWVDFLMSLSDDDLDRGYYHPASKRTVSIREAIALYAWHSKHHLSHIKMVAEGNVEKGSDRKKQSSSKGAGKTNSGKFTGIEPETIGAMPKKRVMSEDHKNKIRTAQQARRAAEKNAKPSVATTSISSAPKKRGPKPGNKTIAVGQKSDTQNNKTRTGSIQTSSTPAKRGRPSNPLLAAAKAAKAAIPKLSRAESMQKARAASAANRAAKGGTAPKKAAPEKTRRARRSSAEVAAEKAAKASAPKLSPAQVMEKARAAAAANRAAKGGAAPKKAAPEKTTRARRSSAEVAAEKAAKASAPKLSRAQVMEKARAAAAANRAAKAATAPKNAAPEKTTRARRSSADVAAEKAAKSSAPKLSRAQVMEKARAAAAANRAAKGQGQPSAKPMKDPSAPKLSQAQALEKARAARQSKKK